MALDPIGSSPQLPLGEGSAMSLKWVGASSTRKGFSSMSTISKGKSPANGCKDSDSHYEEDFGLSMAPSGDPPLWKSSSPVGDQLVAPCWPWSQVAQGPWRFH